HANDLRPRLESKSGSAAVDVLRHHSSVAGREGAWSKVEFPGYGVCRHQLHSSISASLCNLCVSVVNLSRQVIHHRGTEYPTEAQRDNSLNEIHAYQLISGLSRQPLRRRRWLRWLARTRTFIKVRSRG